MRQTKYLQIHPIRYVVYTSTIILLYHNLVAIFTTHTTQGAISFVELAFGDGIIFLNFSTSCV